MIATFEDVLLKVSRFYNSFGQFVANLLAETNNQKLEQSKTPLAIFIVILGFALISFMGDHIYYHFKPLRDQHFMHH